MKKILVALLVIISSFAFITTVSAATTYYGDEAGIASMSTSGGSGWCVPPKNIEGLFKLGLCILGDFVVPFLIGLGLIMFLVGVVNYVRAGDNEEKRTAGRDLMWFGIVALFVMIGVWGFVNILFYSFFGSDTQFSSLPKQATSIFAQ